MKMTLQKPEEIKIFILYLLDKIGYPLCFSDLGTIIIRDNIVDYFAYFEYFCELVEEGHIAYADKNGNPVFGPLLQEEAPADTGDDTQKATKKYCRPDGETLADSSKTFVVTKTGRLISRELSENVLMASIREKSYMSAIRHLSLEKRGATCDQTFEKIGNNYLFKCSIKDKDKKSLLELSLLADNIYQLNSMRINFDDRPDIILRGIISLLTGKVNYLFDE